MIERKPSYLYSAIDRKNFNALANQLRLCGFWEGHNILVAAGDATTGGWSERLNQQLKSAENVKFIKSTVSLNRVPLFIADPFCVNVIDQLATVPLDRVDTNYLKVVGSCEHPAVGMAAYASAANNERFLSWIAPQGSTNAGKEALVDLITKRKSAAQGINIFVNSGHFLHITANMSFRDFLDLEESTEHSESLFCQPEMLSLLATFSRTKGSTPWHIRLSLLKDYVNLKELNEAEDGDISALALSRYVSALPSEQKKNFMQSWNEARFGNRQYIISSLRNSLNTSHLYMYRKFAKENIKQPQGSDYLARVQEEEDPLHPLSHLKAKIGWEREHEIPRGMLNRDFLLLNSLGFKKGMQGQPLTEDSPGPFRSSFTARRVYMLYQKYGLVDNYKHYKTSFHLNVGVPRLEGNIAFLRWLQATGYAYEPVFTDNVLPGEHSSQMYLKTKDPSDGPYCEFKAFDALTASGTARLLKRGSSISHALLAYQNICNEAVAYESVQLERPLTREEILQSSSTIDQKCLALIWLKYQILIEDVFRQIGAGNVITKSAPRHSEMTVFAREIQAALPSYWDRYHKKPNPNSLVGRARRLLLGAHNEVEKVFKDAKADFLAQLTEIAKQPTGEKIKQFFERFPCGTNGETSKFERMEILKLLQRKYKVK